ncbi:A disintegrin and metallopeptidase domain 3-like [Pteronotus mesoamericanus]|uniref:A disintegrin and metallopeptidase domain 3-like n=1 Tax=Pteronotus mesoamericanus TaxID=1884717 RepID=UPI0023EB629E|nr:A disintegrin and metallopeptidase domain 3-like [Pteronotus parnellii mesoamericanus]
MLLLLLVLSCLGRLTSAGQYSETSHLRITVPRKLGTNTNDGDASETRVIYAIKIDRKTYTLHLEKQSFLDPHFLVYSYNESGTLYPDSSFTKDHCLYQGYAAEIPKSVVTLRTCSGLRGLLQLENVSYGIEPLESAATFEHILYQIKNNKTDFFLSRGNYPTTQSADQPYKILVKSEKKSGDVLLKKTLKIQIIMDKALYDYMGSEVAVAVEKVVHILGLINSMFSQLNMTVMLTSLELWSDKNKILSNGDANEVLQRFVSWKESFLFRRSRDMAFLLIYRDSPNYVGATYRGMACDPKLAAGVVLYPKKISLEAFSVVMAQLLGINLGLTYDDIYNCYCPGTVCIMNPQAIRSRGVKFFSSCSEDEYKGIVSQPELKCLQNGTVFKLAAQGRQMTCGNGILETGEQCDCGRVQTCAFKKCCNPATCVLIGYAECGSGPCCDKNTCLIRERGHICRRSIDPCDFTEFCNGLSEFCMPDMKSADLETCNNKTAYCFSGICQDMDKQCAQAFGKYAKGADFLCLQEVNIQNDLFGDCRHRRCSYMDTICGKLVCHWTHTSLSIPTSGYDIQYTYYGGHVCMSGNLRHGAKIKNLFVRDGTMCDENRFCQRSYCRPVGEYNRTITCNAITKCNGHGVCNSRGNCHCDAGYAPPSCDPSVSSPGGSIDDGFWILSEEKNVNFPKRKPRGSPRKNGLLISFCIFLPFLILIAVIALKWNKIKFWVREEPVSEGVAISRSSSLLQDLGYDVLHLYVIVQGNMHHVALDHTPGRHMSQESGFSVRFSEKQK